MMFVYALLVSLAAAQTVGPAVTVQNLRLYYGTDEYYVKGMAYSPSPLAKVVENQNWGSGLCTPKRAYSPGTYSIALTSPCYLEDYFDGTVYPGGPSGGWWNGVWQRDFPMMQSLGVNTIRIYHADPITSLAVKNDGNYTDKSVIGANHIPFLDLAQSYGLKVMFPLYADESAIGTISPAFMFKYIENLIDEVGYHPAVLMYQFGNELQFLNNDDNYVRKINGYLSYARSYQKKRWNRALPVSTALIDYPPYYNTLVPALDIDIITTNAGYRGWNFQNLWSGAGSTFWGLQALSCMTGRPTLIGEMGIHSGQSSSVAFDLPNAMGDMMTDLIAHKTSGAIGGVYFEWQEEHWKGVARVGDDWTKAADVFMGAITLTNGTGQFPVDVAHTKTGGAYDWTGATRVFSMSPWKYDGPSTLGQATKSFCSGVTNTVSTGLSTYTQAPATTNAPVNVNPVPAPAQGACGGAPSCNGQCFDSTIYTCTTDANTGNAVLCWGNATNAASCNGQCYNPATMVCGSSGLYLKSATPAKASTSSTSPVKASTSSTSSTKSVAGTSTTKPAATTSALSCSAMFASLQCRTRSQDPTQLDSSSVSGALNWLCNFNDGIYCKDINVGGAYSGCNQVERLSQAMNAYFQVFAPMQGAAAACNFGGIGVTVAPGASSSTAAPTAAAPSTSGVDCHGMYTGLRCRVFSEDATQVDTNAVNSARSWLCNFNSGAYCTDIVSGGAYTSCTPIQQLSQAMNRYYAAFAVQQGTQACNFGGIGKVVGNKRWLGKV